MKKKKEKEQGEPRYNVLQDSVGTTQLKTELIAKEEEIVKLLRFINERKSGMPEGKLRISTSKGYSQYYHITEAGDTNGCYIKKEDIELARNLATKSYYEKLENALLKELKAVRELLNVLNNSSEMIYEKISSSRRELITPLLISDELYGNMWMSEPFEMNPFYSDELIYETKRGDMVRSKAELIIADIYYDLGIPYRYEAKLNLKNGEYRFPDFTVLDVRKRKVVYHEHLGLIDSEEYRLSNLRKMEQYQDSGIYQGSNLLLTYESENIPLNTRFIRQTIINFFRQ